MNSHHIDLLKKALEAFESATSLHFNIDKINPANNQKIQECILSLKNEKVDVLFLAEIKHQLSKTTLTSPPKQLNSETIRRIFITNYVNPNLAELLKNSNINFLDTVGNAYINTSSLLIYIKGNKAPTLMYPSSAFSTAGIKLIFLFLCCPESLHASYREIANEANVGLGSVVNVLNSLKEKGYLIKKGPLCKKLRNKENLIDDWVKAYSERLRKKLIIGNYLAIEANWWKKANLRKLNTYWGGEAAASKLTHYLKPEMITLYTQEKSAEIQIAHKLESSSKGNVELLQKFWHFKDEWEKQGLVPPLLVYADLINSANSRNIETAKMIYEQEFDRYLKDH